MNGRPEGRLGEEPSKVTVSALLASDIQRQNPFEDFARSAAYSALQSPVKALAQPMDHALGTQVEKAVSLIDAPQTAKFNTQQYWSQQLGHAVGTLATFYVVGRVVKNGMRSGLTETQLAVTLSERGVLGLTLKEVALTGFLHDSVLRPQEHDDKRAFLEARLGNGLNGAATMTVLTASAFGLKKSGVPGEALRGVLSGAPAGLVNCNFDSFLRTGKLASAEESAKAVTTMSMIGGAFGLYHQGYGRYESGRSNFDWQTDTKTPCENTAIREFRVKGGELEVNKALATIAQGEAARLTVQERLSGGNFVSRWLGLSRYAPEQSLLIRHGPEVSASLAARVDLVASCHLNPELVAKAVVDTPGAMFLRAGKNRISIADQPQIVRPGEAPPIELSSPVSKSLLELADKLGDRTFRRANEGLQYHDLLDYARLLAETPYRTVDFMGAGFESVAFLLKSGSVLKLTRCAELPNGEWNYDWGTRSYDAKIKGEVTIFEGKQGELAVYRQPRVEIGAIDVTSLEYRDFVRKVRRAGDEFWDSDFAGDQVGFLMDSKSGDYVVKPHRGRSGKFMRDSEGKIMMLPSVVLIDYPAVAPKGEHP
ncbi:MAG: hypothetical protein K2W95_16310 [Candidatus Obscuribacterales bacterium]|nr:hypothetical protein [Candidatus Obscuribacterales bacterium]